MLSKLLPIFAILLLSASLFAQTPPIEPGVSHELAKWRAAHYDDVRYKLNLTLEKMSPVLKGTIEIRVNVGTRTPSSATPAAAGEPVPIILDWRRIRGHEEKSAISNVTINDTAAFVSPPQAVVADGGVRVPVEESNEHLIFRNGVVAGENLIKLDFTSPILTSGSAITRYVDKEDGAEYIYSLFVPSDASTAFPVFDQPDLKARFDLTTYVPMKDGGLLWKIVSNSAVETRSVGGRYGLHDDRHDSDILWVRTEFEETKPISTYVFAFAAGPFERVSEPPALAGGTNAGVKPTSGPETQRPQNATALPPAYAGGSDIYVRKSQLAKFQPHAAEVFRLNREGIKYLEGYFDYKFPFPKYDIVLIPEFPFGGMEHAGATFLREDRVIFPQEPTKNDYITRANLIFHEAAHQWFGDTVTMKWFDDLWLKEGFAEFMAYKTLEKVMPEYNAWKVFYERNKQAAYLTDSTKGTTPIYQEIANLNSAKSAYGNIVYRKAPSFLKQAEFYLGPDKFQTAVRAFLKKHEYANAGWEDLVKEFETASGNDLKDWAKVWVGKRGLPYIKTRLSDTGFESRFLFQENRFEDSVFWQQRLNVLSIDIKGNKEIISVVFERANPNISPLPLLIRQPPPNGAAFVFPNHQDYGYGIFLLDDKSRNYVLKNIQNETDDFLRTMMWGSLWDSVREAELSPEVYVELIVKNLNIETDESTIQSLLSRVSTAMTYYLSDTQRAALAPKVEAVLIEKMRTAPTMGQRITYYRAFLHIASTAKARAELKRILKGSEPGMVVTGFFSPEPKNPVAIAPGADRRNPSAISPDSDRRMPLKSKDRFDIVTKLLILGDEDASALLADLEKTETSDEAKRYAYAAKAGVANAGNKAKYWSDLTSGKNISESWIEAAFGPFNSPLHADLTLPFLDKALAQLPTLKRDRKIFFVNGWLGAFIGGQKSEQALAIVNKFLNDNPHLDKDLRLKILENVDLIERAVKIRKRFNAGA